ncbi:cupin-like domain-containing protein [Seonamhaeicola sp.]|uniref:cupin-like domain-containing protein n=1 Tax=Seonamhaeicola sp. TaxID=1912245 RepID=UPI00260F7533|nr:cupin-like domain-containing protein [Seonamhaeicola sp.]
MDILDDIVKSAIPLEESKEFDHKLFHKNFIKKRKPVLLKGYAKNWPALKKWDFEFLSGLKLEESVRVEVGNVIQNEINVERFDFSTYLKKLKDYEEKPESERPYLSMFNIFGHFPELFKDVDLSILSDYTKYNTPGGWIGPAGTVTGFHWDSTDNILTQVKGRKLVLLVAPKDSSKMYESKKYDYDAHGSMVDINNFDEAKFPKFRDAVVYKVILEPGDTLYNPRKWWHYVKSLDTSISVSNFGRYKKDFTYYKEFVEYRLHMRGYYRTQDCTCHKTVEGKRIWLGRS